MLFAFSSSLHWIRSLATDFSAPLSFSSPVSFSLALSRSRAVVPSISLRPASFSASRLDRLCVSAAQQEPANVIHWCAKQTMVTLVFLLM